MNQETEFDEFVKPRKVRKDKRHHEKKAKFDDDEIKDVKKSGRRHSRMRSVDDDSIFEDLDGLDISEIKRVLR